MPPYRPHAVTVESTAVRVHAGERAARVHQLRDDIEAATYPVGYIPPGEFLDPAPHERTQRALAAAKVTPGFRHGDVAPLERYWLLRDYRDALAGLR